MIDIEFKKRLLSSLIILPLTFFFIINGSLIFLIFLIAILIICIFEWIKMNTKFELKFLGVLFLCCSFYTFYLIRINNLSVLLFIIAVCISTDLGGYIFGKLLKGPKLTKISPNKTYFGMLGGFIFPLLTSYFFFLKYNYMQNDIFIKYNEEYISFIIIVLIISSVSQIGDLIISYFKRASKLKNTGNIIPGHGGMLDRVDGMIFVFPLFYILNL